MTTLHLKGSPRPPLPALSGAPVPLLSPAPHALCLPSLSIADAMFDGDASTSPSKKPTRQVRNEVKRQAANRTLGPEHIRRSVESAGETMSKTAVRRAVQRAHKRLRLGKPPHVAIHEVLPGLSFSPIRRPPPPSTSMCRDGAVV